MAMTPLGTLIEEAKALFQDAHGVPLTNGDIARRSNGRLTRGRVQQLATGRVKAMPSPDVIRGLSMGLGVPESVVTERALQSAGYVVPGFAASVPDTPNGMPLRDEIAAVKEMTRRGAAAELAEKQKRLNGDTPGRRR